MFFFVFKQKTAYEMRISDWSSDVCSSDLMYAPTSTTEITEVATGNTVTVPTNAANPDLEAETSLNLELGYRWESERARVGISVFRDRYDDFIDSERLTANPDVEYEVCSRGSCTIRFGYDYNMLANHGPVTVKGLELEGLWRVGDAWAMRAAWTPNEGEQQRSERRGGGK